MEGLFGAATGVFRVALLFELFAHRAQLVEQLDNGLLAHCEQPIAGARLLFPGVHRF
jgi:hypothetical protein